jgi:hypothetical protein
MRKGLTKNPTRLFTAHRFTFSCNIDTARPFAIGFHQAAPSQGLISPANEVTALRCANSKVAAQ